MKPKYAMLLDYVDELITAYDNFINYDDKETTLDLIDKIDNLTTNRCNFNGADANLLYFTDAVIDSFKTYTEERTVCDDVVFENFADLMDKIRILKGYREERINYKRQNQVLSL